MNKVTPEGDPNMPMNKLYTKKSFVFKKIIYGYSISFERNLHQTDVNIIIAQ